MAAFRVDRRVINLDYAIGMPLIVLTFISSDTLSGLFTNDAEVIRTAFYPFCVMLSTFILSVSAYIWCNAIIGPGNTLPAFLFQMINIVIYLFYTVFQGFRLPHTGQPNSYRSLY